MVSCSPQVLRAGKFMPSQTPKAEQDWLWLSLENPEISRVWLGTLGVPGDSQRGWQLFLGSSCDRKGRWQLQSKGVAGGSRAPNEGFEVRLMGIGGNYWV